jgi:anthranilate synthase component 1
MDPAGRLEQRLLRSRRGFLIEKGGKAYLGANPKKVIAPSFNPPKGPVVGWLSYEMVRDLENVPVRKGDLGRLMVFDRIEEFEACEPLEGRARAGAWRDLGGKAAFLKGVRKLKEHIRAGDIFQAVLSTPFEAKVSGSPADVYRRLRRESPAPFHFWIADGDRHLIGASPERLVSVENGTARNMPIAGTRKRGKNRGDDLRLERNLRRSPKERAEHVMLVDLARNDLGKVCRPGSVKVSSYQQVKRFSNVMHLVSEVEGRLDKSRKPWDALAACFPAGTVSGAPKVRAIELIAGLEKTPRGFYSGVVVFGDGKNLESILTIRSLMLSKGKARIQAGAGIVADSKPEREYQEVLDKLAAIRRALA